MPQINRTGTIHFGDASFSIFEEGLGGTLQERDNWGREFKREVFTRIIQQLNRLGWTVGPWEDAAHYKAIANNHRSCNKGPLRGELEVSWTPSPTATQKPTGLTSPAPLRTISRASSFSQKDSEPCRISNASGDRFTASGFPANLSLMMARAR